MSKIIPTVQKYMSTSPHTIGSDQKILKAQEMMREFRIRHLPVLKGGSLVGIISDRDIKLALSLVSTSMEQEMMMVEDVFQAEVYTISPAAHLDQVASDMAARKLGSALVVDNGKLVGIFTAVDGLMALSELLSTRLKD
jgi:acetoin utilization protein AcuB